MEEIQLNRVKRKKSCVRDQEETQTIRYPIMKLSKEIVAVKPR